MKIIILLYIMIIQLRNNEEYRKNLVFIIFCCLIPVFIAAGIVRGLARRLLRKIMK